VDLVADRLHAAALHLSRRLRIEDDALGVSAPRLSVLSIITSQGPMRIGALAVLEEVEPPTMSRLVDGLERDGYVERRTDPQDARAVQVRATAAGGRAMRRERARRVTVLAGWLGSLSHAELGVIARGVEVLDRALRGEGLIPPADPAPPPA
jgi:DNA-binding MarR family transcriptional regulator